MRKKNMIKQAKQPVRAYEAPFTKKTEVESEAGICATSGQQVHSNSVEVQATEQQQGDIIDVSDNNKNEWY